MRQKLRFALITCLGVLPILGVDASYAAAESNHHDLYRVAAVPGGPIPVAGYREVPLGKAPDVAGDFPDDAPPPYHEVVAAEDPAEALKAPPLAPHAAEFDPALKSSSSYLLADGQGVARGNIPLWQPVTCCNTTELVYPDGTRQVIDSAVQHITAQVRYMGAIVPEQQIFALLPVGATADVVEQLDEGKADAAAGETLYQVVVREAHIPQSDFVQCYDCKRTQKKIAFAKITITRHYYKKYLVTHITPELYKLLDDGQERLLRTGDTVKILDQFSKDIGTFEGHENCANKDLPPNSRVVNGF